MRGAILGDIIGSRFEFSNCKSKRFDLFPQDTFFTDDSVMTIAVASALMRWKDEGGDLRDWAVKEMRRIGCAHFNSGYGGMFRNWLKSGDPQPYNSWGNGAAMRVSSCGWVGQSIEEVKDLSAAVTEVTHNHPEGMKGAEATAVCVYLARIGKTKDEIKRYVLDNYYSIDFTLDEIREDYHFEESCQGTVPQALEAFFEADGFIDAIRNAISIGGDSDTIGAITGGVAEACWGISPRYLDWVRMKLPTDLYEIVGKFVERYVTV